MTATHRESETVTNLDVQESRRRISTALETAGIAQQTNERSTEL